MIFPIFINYWISLNSPSILIFIFVILWIVYLPISAFPSFYFLICVSNLFKNVFILVQVILQIFLQAWWRFNVGKFVFIHGMSYFVLIINVSLCDHLELIWGAGPIVWTHVSSRRFTIEIRKFVRWCAAESITAFNHDTCVWLRFDFGHAAAIRDFITRYRTCFTFK